MQRHNEVMRTNLFACSNILTYNSYCWNHFTSVHDWNGLLLGEVLFYNVYVQCNNQTILLQCYCTMEQPSYLITMLLYNGTTKLSYYNVTVQWNNQAIFCKTLNPMIPYQSCNTRKIRKHHNDYQWNHISTCDIVW